MYGNKCTLKGVFLSYKNSYRLLSIQRNVISFEQLGPVENGGG